MCGRTNMDEEMIEKLLFKAADIQKFGPKDKLNEIIHSYSKDKELSIFDLDLINAAGQTAPNINNFKKKFGL